MFDKLRKILAIVVTVGNAILACINIYQRAYAR